MKNNNFITVERICDGFCIVLANVNGKKIRSRETFISKGAAVAKAILISYKRQMDFRMTSTLVSA